MKIAVLLYPVSNIGGIVNHTEQLAGGLKDLGHQVDLIMLCYQGKFMSPKKTNDEILENPEYEMGEFGLPVSQFAGWYMRPNIDKIAYYGEENIKSAKERLSEYDLLIWSIPVPTKQRANQGNMDWLTLYDVPVKQVAIIHDGNFAKSYPWINKIKSHLSGLACVHPCAYNSAKDIDIPRALIVNPQNMDNIYIEEDWDSRKKGWLSVQTFKGWKHVDDLIRAVPYMSDDLLKILGGGGLEFSYMTSLTKTKPQYMVNRKNDPDIPQEVIDRNIRIFDLALEHNMKWLGFINTKKRDSILRSIRTLVDPSWNLKYASTGDHFNRVTNDAIMQGAIPIARNLGISDNEDGIGLMYKPDENYIMVPYNATPKEFAQLVDHASNLSKNESSRILSNNYEVIKKFDRKKIAQYFIDLSNGEPCGLFNKIETGILSDDIVERSDYIIREFFENVQEA